jgi:hypothetical protein|mmetsp:Transcript_14238/g.2323  ORF Transcript_14238/g.2323 Transcript_14238/m.2323 type:complete len:92 (-) Transcript_14238:537-812(-)
MTVPMLTNSVASVKECSQDHNLTIMSLHVETKQLNALNVECMSKPEITRAMYVSNKGNASTAKLLFLKVCFKSMFMTVVIELSHVVNAKSI